MPGLVSGDIKSPSPLALAKGHKQIGHEVLPSRHAKAALTGGDLFQRSMNNYAKQDPSVPDGSDSPGMNINTLPMMQP